MVCIFCGKISKNISTKYVILDFINYMINKHLYF